jgi:tRNA-binding protein
VVKLTVTEVDYLLETLCVDLGFCLPPRAISQFQQNPPRDVESFTYAVFIAEGMDPRHADRKLLAQVRDVVQKAFARAASNKELGENEAMKVAPIKPTIPLELLERVDIRVGTIRLVEDVAGSDKLVKLTVDFGDHSRTILVGMKQEREHPAEIEGRQALFVVNLEPKQLMGQVSEGMLLDIGYADGITPVLATPEEPVPNGARAG